MLDWSNILHLKEIEKKVRMVAPEKIKEMRERPVEEIKYGNSKMIRGEAIDQMRKIPSGSVDLICTDLPYGVTNNKWDFALPFDEMWEEFYRVTKNNAAIVLTATEPFASLLRLSSLKYYKYDCIWEKTIASGQLNVKRQQLRVHENILVFYKKPPTYNEQKTPGTPYSIKRKGEYAENNNYNKQKPSEKENDGFRHARSVIKISNPRVKAGHTTQKPVELMEYILKTYSNENDTVLDCCMGYGTTGIAALNLNRHFIGIEIDDESFKSAKDGINRIYNDDTR